MRVNNSVLFFLISYLITSPTLSSADVISLRIENMQKADKAMTMIKNNIIKSDYKKAQKNAEDINKWANEMLNYFPPDSGASIQNTSAASSEIWKDFKLFKTYVSDKKNNTKLMVVAAKNNKMENLKQSFTDTRKTCITCHEKFRN